MQFTARVRFSQACARISPVDRGQVQSAFCRGGVKKIVGYVLDKSGVTPCPSMANANIRAVLCTRCLYCTKLRNSRTPNRHLIIYAIVYPASNCPKVLHSRYQGFSFGEEAPFAQIRPGTYLCTDDGIDAHFQYLWLEDVRTWNISQMLSDTGIKSSNLPYCLTIRNLVPLPWPARRCSSQTDTGIPQAKLA